MLNRLIPIVLLAAGLPAATAAPESKSKADAPLPPAATRKVDFASDLKPLIEASCVQCHAKGKAKGGLSLETREGLTKGGDSGAAAVPGRSADSLMVKLVASADADEIMPKKGTHWTPEQVGLLRGWIDQGMNWPANLTFAKPPPQNLKPRTVSLPGDEKAGPALDRLLAAYLKQKGIASPQVVDDRTFARRVYLDTIGLLPAPTDLQSFVDDKSPDKRATLVRKLLSDNTGYADNWLTFWNDLLRNDYKGTGYIDGGRKQITGWLYSSLLLNKPYDQFVRELVNPGPDSEGFSKGIVWRGVVPASMTPPMQAAQSISQAFFGINLKCASCHDSFVSDWTLADAYGLAAIYSDKPLEMVRCDRALGKTVDARFLYPEIGAIDPKLSRVDRLKRFADLMTAPANGRLSRNIVNRLWARLLGRGLVDPVDDMDKPAWSADILDWMAEDLVAHQYDLKHTIELILNSKAYQLAVTDQPAEGEKIEYVFRGPWARRLTAEQFADAVSSLTGDWARVPSSIEFDFSGGGKLTSAKPPTWIWTNEPVSDGIRRTAEQLLAKPDKPADAAPAKPAKPAVKPKTETAKPMAAGKGRGKNAAPATPAEPAKSADPTKSTDSTKPTDPAIPLRAFAASLAHNPEAVATLAAAPEKLNPAYQSLVRHKVVFRQTFTLDAIPEQAYAAVAASQRVEVTINGKSPSATVNDRGGSSRTAVLDLRSVLQKGQNVVVLAVDSHTERPTVRADDREKLPAVFNYLNERSGVGFVARLVVGGKPVEWTTDETWRACRAPQAGWQTDKFDDAGWPKATILPEGTSPADDGVVIDDNGRKPAGKTGFELGPKIQGLMALNSRIGRIRSPLVASDPMQIALDRPNREQVVSCRQCAATTIQALELTNGSTLDGKLRKAAAKLAEEAAKDPGSWIDSVYRQSLCRLPTDGERRIARDLLGLTPKAEAVADFLWAVLMQPEFQFVH